MASHVDFEIFDCDNHYYEAIDAFTRYAEPGMAKRTMQWGEIDGKQRLLVGGKINRFIPNPTFDPISKPGALDEYFRGRNPKGEGVRELFGDLDPMSDHPEYRDRDARLKLMDEQGMRGAIFLPTLGVGMEQALLDDPPALLAAFRAFNRWLEEDWGFAYQERIFGAPDGDARRPRRGAEVGAVGPRPRRPLLRARPRARDHALGSGVARRPGVRSDVGSPRESGAVVTAHGGNAYYSRYLADWGEGTEMEAFRQNPFRSIVSWSAVQDWFANLLAHGLFQRFPNLRMASIETGSDWVFHLFDKLKKSYSQTPQAYPEDPRETFKRHVWVSPYYEDELASLRDILGADHMLMGSDFPHAEGLAEPSSYIKDLENFGFTPEDSRLVMRDNGVELSQRRPA